MMMEVARDRARSQAGHWCLLIMLFYACLNRFSAFVRSDFCRCLVASNRYFDLGVAFVGSAWPVGLKYIVIKLSQ